MKRLFDLIKNWILVSKKRIVIFWASVFVLSVAFCVAVYSVQAYCFAPHKDWLANKTMLMSKQSDWEDLQNGYVLSIRPNNPPDIFVGKLSGGMLPDSLDVFFVAAGYDMIFEQGELAVAYAEWSYDSENDLISLHVTEVYDEGYSYLSDDIIILHRRN